MAASVLNSPQAIEMSIYVVRTFVRLREALASNKLLARKLEELEKRIDSQDDSIVEILRAIRQLMDDRVDTPATRKRPIGFVTPTER